jgi:hypothetical protein
VLQSRGKNTRVDYRNTCALGVGLWPESAVGLRREVRMLTGDS